MSGPFEGRVAMVSGASRGIGRAIALELGEAGAEVIVTATSLSAAEATVEGIHAAGGSGRAVELDVSDAASVDETVRALLEAYDRIPLLVNNAGITRDSLFLRMKPEDWSAVIETNLTGVYRLCRALTPGMVRARYGRIVNVTSVVGHVGNPGQVNYAAAKAGVEGLTKSLARELGSRNITVNCVAPGFIDTDMTRGLAEPARRQLLEQVLLRRLGTVEEVAHAVVYLLGDAAGYVTGTTLHVNGGMYI